MESLLDDLLTYSRIGRIEAKVETVNLTALFHDIVHMLAPPNGFEISIPAQLPVIRAVRTPLDQVIRNLIGNAIKHHPSPDTGLITVAVHTLGNFLEFSICDNGSGIPEQYHQKIFQMFQTLRPRDEVEGSGMGLAMVKKIVEDQGGRVWLTSEVDRGSCFYFTWPREPRKDNK
jgi:signal transduction histidine kinase